MKKLKPINRWDLASVIFFLTLLGILILIPNLTTTYYDDISYHLMAAQNFERSGGIVAWDLGESLPTGRAHNYPPLLHILLIPLLKLHLDGFLLIRLIASLAVLISLLLGWAGLRHLFGQRPAFFFLAVTGFSGAYLPFLAVLIPASIVFALTPWLIYLLKNGKTAAAAVLLAVMLYTHMFIPGLIIVTLIFWSLIQRQQFKTTLIAIGAALLLYSPLALYVVLNWDFIKYFNVSYLAIDKPVWIGIDVSISLLFILAVWYLWPRVKEDRKSYWQFFFLLTLVQTPLFFTNYPGRFFISGGFFAIAITIAILLDQLASQSRRRLLTGLIVGILVAGNIINIQIWFNQADFSSARLEVNRAFFSQAAAIWLKGSAAWPKLKDYPYTDANRRLAKSISQSSQENEVIYTLAKRFNGQKIPWYRPFAVGQFFAALSNRPMANPRMPEYFWHQPPPLEQIRILIINQDDPIINRTDFQIVAQNDELVVLQNKRPGTLKIDPPKPVLNQYLAWLIILLAALFIGREIKNLTQKKYAIDKKG